MAWVAVVAFLLLGEIGTVIGLNQWAMDASPFTHIPKIPSAPFAATPLVWLTAVAAGAIVAGLAGLRGREIG